MRGRVEGWMHRRKAPSKAYTSGSDLGCDGEVLARHPDAPWLYRIVMNIDNTALASHRYWPASTSSGNGNAGPVHLF